MRFYLGTHETSWLQRAGVPLFVSARRLRRRFPSRPAAAPWALDSGGFSELTLHGGWSTRPAVYAQEARAWMEALGSLDFAAPQDWMCEPHLVARTGLTVEEHQARTIRSFHELRALEPRVPWIPVLQGWTARDYQAHVEAWERSGVALAQCPTVGIGSVCRRQSGAVGAALVREFSSLRLHGFGFKMTGLKAVGHLLASSDSLAWSFRARREGRALCGGGHATCANCLSWALTWRSQLPGFHPVPSHASDCTAAR